MIDLKLYVTGSSLRARDTIRKTKEILGHFAPDCTLAIIDVLDDPASAERDRIIATPTIVRKSPLPERRVIGDISDPHTLLDALGLERVDGDGTSGGGPTTRAG